jgi:tetratricopeptide (TPR) repeat protein
VKAWLERLTLSLAVRCLGVAALVLSLVAKWFQLPETVKLGPGLAPVVVGREAPATYAFKLIVAGALLAFLFRSRPRIAAVTRTPAHAALLVVMLLFPHAVMVWCPVTGAKASWLHTQHQSLTWFGGDLFALQETKDRDWKSHVYAADVLDQATTMNVPALNPDPVPFGGLRDSLDWLGYSNSFCQFVRAGWELAIAGCFLLVLAPFCRGGPPDRLRRAIAVGVLKAGAATACVGGLLALAPAVLAATELDRARLAAERGWTELALERLQFATRMLPIVGQESDVAVQEGLLEEALGRDTPEAALYRAKVLQGLGRFEEAETLFESLVVGPGPGPVRREASRGLLRRGIRELNSGETNSAVVTLETVLDVDPCNVKANYVLQLAYLRAGRFDTIDDLVARMRATYKFFHDDTKMPVLAAAQENAAYAAYLQDDVPTAHALWQALGDPKQLDP